MSALVPGTTSIILGRKLMCGSARIGLLIVSVACTFSLVAAPSFAGPRFWTDRTTTTLLRDVATTPAHQPDAMEIVNDGGVELKTSAGIITCTEVELGGTVVSNTAALAKIALPFGAAEGDSCTVGASNVPTYFDTLATGAVGNAANGNGASITATEPSAGELIATINDLKLSHKVPGIGFCTSNLDGIKGTITNVVAEFVEEKTPNLNAQFTKAKVPIEGTGCPTEGEFSANFLLETPSTATDTALLEAAPPEWKKGGVVINKLIAFTVTSGATTLEAGGGARVFTCKKDSGTGEIEAPNRIKKLKLTFVECMAKEGVKTCEAKTTGAAKEEVVMNELEGEVRTVAKKEAATERGAGVTPVVAPVVTIQAACILGGKETFEGTVIGEVTKPVKKQEAKGELVFTIVAKKQKIQEFKDGTKFHLTATLVEATLESSESLTFAEAVELT
jgi:hypothetical protein